MPVHFRLAAERDVEDARADALFGNAHGFCDRLFVEGDLRGVIAAQPLLGMRRELIIEQQPAFLRLGEKVDGALKDDRIVRLRKPRLSRGEGKKEGLFAQDAPARGRFAQGRERKDAPELFLVEKGKLLFGTVDTWLIWRLTRGEVHVTDVSNASRTMLFNIHTLQWDEDLLRLFDIPLSMMPEVRSSSEVYGATKTTIFAHKVPIAGVAGDQQAALFGQMCVEPGSVKNTYGTGCFLLMNSGDRPILSQNNLLTTVAWKIGDRVDYALEGSIFVGGSVVQWLRDGLGIIRSSSEVEALAATVPDAGGVYFVPALTGLAAPYWDQYARGAISGISRGTTAAHIARAALEGIAYQTYDIVGAMQRDSGIALKELKVDGGAARNNLLMQFQADLLGTKVIRPRVTETTALGAAYLAGLAVGYWSNIDEIRLQWQADSVFDPTAERSAVEASVAGWKDAVRRVLHDGTF